jgi:membrane-bound ClpP family serine protease
MTAITTLTIFLIIGCVGFLFLMISLIVGDLFDAFDFDMDLDTNGDFGLFDSRVVSVFLTALGFVGALAVQFGFGAIFGALFGLASGIVLGAFVFAFGYFLHSQQASSSVGDKDLLGRTAQVVVGIRPGSVGQISCLVGDERIEKVARTANGEGIEAGKTVFIEEITGEAFIVALEEDKRNLGLFS